LNISFYLDVDEYFAKVKAKRKEFCISDLVQVISIHMLYDEIQLTQL